MTLDASCVGWISEIGEYRYGWRELVLYALGIGSTISELEYLYESHGPKVFPTFGVIPAFPQVTSCALRAGIVPEDATHLGQNITILDRLPPEGTLVTQGQIVGIYDVKKLSVVHVRTRTKLKTGTPVFDTEWTIAVPERIASSYSIEGRQRPSLRDPLGRAPRGTDPDHSVQQQVRPEQALIYRLSGDHNPLHVDPILAAKRGFGERPILHGLATFGYAARALVSTVCNGNADRIRFIAGVFKRPVWPGDTLTTEIWRTEDRIVFQTKVDERNEIVLGHAWARIED